MRSGSGETCTPRISMSSPVLAITDSSAPASSWNPTASLAPPVPPASSATFMPSPGVLGQPGDAKAGVGLVAAVDRDQQGGELLDDSRHLQRAGVHRPQAAYLPDQLGHARLVGLAVAAYEDVLVELGREIAELRGADRVQGGDHRDPVGDHLLCLL